MTSTFIAERLERFIRHQFAVADSDTRFGRDVMLFDSGYVDSMGVNEVLVFLETEFGVRIPDEDLLDDRFQTIDGMAQAVARLRTKAA